MHVIPKFYANLTYDRVYLYWWIFVYSLGFEMQGHNISYMIATPGIYDVTLTVSKNGRKSSFTQSLIADVGMKTESTSFIRYGPPD